MSAYSQIRMHGRCLLHGNLWVPAKRRFHINGIHRALVQLLHGFS